MSVCMSAELAWDREDAADFGELCMHALGRDAICLGGLVCALAPATELTLPWPRDKVA
jgi:hypothetical protein